ncbi:MAG: DNA topoisomerase, partial [Candidatus Bipolaricaulota bacterium]|nr:DNA topoisomerase [Candidatus Bipolaricaulota bacterium]
ASQMASAELDQTTVEIADATGKIRLRASGSVLVFDGFLKLYREDEDDRAADARAGLGKAEDEETRILPPMAERDPLARGPVEAAQHFTQAPPRYTEASLIKRLEELGIGPFRIESLRARWRPEGEEGGRLELGAARVALPGGGLELRVPALSCALRRSVAATGCEGEMRWQDG